MDAAMTRNMRIGELARRSRTKAETIRYYEHIRLLPEPSRSLAGYRLCGEPELRRLLFIRRARELGFTIDRVRALLSLAGDGRVAPICAEAREVAACHLAEIRAKIEDLAAMERVLAEAVQRCGEGEAPRCPIIETLSAA
jgi:MerR family mercuric resistance operon transcriptional regulator